MPTCACMRALALLWLLLAAPLVAQPLAARLPDGRTLAFSCAGEGQPAFLLEAGWAADSRAFAGLLARLSALSRACAYDRAGAGDSSPGPLPRTPAAIAQDLVAGLAAAGIDGPLILVGHSAGAIYARETAALLPAGRVVGLLLLDPSIDAQTAVLAARGGPGAGTIAPFVARARRCAEAAAAGADMAADPALKACGGETGPAAAAKWQARESEIATLFLDDPAAAAARAAATARVPVIVLTAGAGRAPESLALWEDLHRALAAQSPRGRQETVAGAGHMLMREAPEAIVAAAGALLAAARAAPPAAP